MTVYQFFASKNVQAKNAI